PTTPKEKKTHPILIKREGSVLTEELVREAISSSSIPAEFDELITALDQAEYESLMDDLTSDSMVKTVENLTKLAIASINQGKHVEKAQEALDILDEIPI